MERVYGHVLILFATVYTAELLNTKSLNVKFTVSNICGTLSSESQIGVNKNVTSTFMCGRLCAHLQECVSFYFLNESKTCILNKEVIVDIGTCETDVLHGVKTKKSECTDSINNMRLCNGTGFGEYDSHKGRVEVFYDAQWWSVCDDNWELSTYGKLNANVVCKALGYVAGDSVVQSAFGGRHSFLLDDVDCSGLEASLLDCNHRGFGQHNCGSGEFVGVVCSSSVS